MVLNLLKVWGIKGIASLSGHVWTYTSDTSYWDTENEIASNVIICIFTFCNIVL